jgi:hypothetical protein
MTPPTNKDPEKREARHPEHRDDRDPEQRDSRQPEQRDARQSEQRDSRQPEQHDSPPAEQRDALGAEHRDALRAALESLRTSAQKSRAPTRHQARDLLLALGAALRADDEVEIDAASTALRSLEASSSSFRDRWRAAIADEITLACTEHVRSVDPRYLEHPQYDWEYTIAARERLELRLRAAAKLGFPAAAAQLAQVARADALLAGRQERHAGRSSKRDRDTRP